MTANTESDAATTGQMTIDGYLPRPLDVGDHVRDREGDGQTLLVVGVSATTAEEYFVTSEGETVADLNEDYPADDTIVNVVYPTTDDLGIDGGSYAFPRSRLVLENPIHGG